MGAMNELIDADAVAGLRAKLQTAAPGLDLAALAGVAATFGEASLRERTDLVSAALLADLPADYSAAAAVFRAALADPSFGGWTVWPVGETVTTLALAEPSHFADALGLLAELTPRLTAEFPIRRLLEHDLDAALPVVHEWTRSPDPHVRRLASEGTRAFLPWAIRVRALLARPDATVPILDALYRDESDYVRRSVANHLNDLARQNPDLVVEVARRWLADPGAGDIAANTAWVVRHGLRTLVKKAHPGALAVMGFAPVSVTVSDPVLDSAAITLPGDLGFRFILTNDGETTERMAVDYVVHFVKSNGRQAEKVFKLTAATLAPGESMAIAKRHALRQMTTRVHYAGTHSLELQVNGRRHTRTDFEVLV
jgi:3-methyladenine DNA glycosylase AlkC